MDDMASRAVEVLTRTVHETAKKAVEEAPFARMHRGKVLRQRSGGRYEVEIMGRVVLLPSCCLGDIGPGSSVWVMAPHNESNMADWFVLGLTKVVPEPVPDEEKRKE